MLPGRRNRISAKTIKPGPAPGGTIVIVGTFVDATCEPPQAFTYGGMIADILTFGSHRRTLVCGALYAAGITDLGAGDPLHWVAEHAA